jgi:hypothetical protein
MIMRRSILLAAVLGSGLILAGCQTNAGGGAAPPPGGTTTPTQDPRITQIQSTIENVCAYRATAATIASLITAWTGGGAVVGMANDIATAVCSSVVRTASVRGRKMRAPTVRAPNGQTVVIQGQFVRR